MPEATPRKANTKPSAELRLLGSRIRSLRLKKGLSMERLAYSVELSKESVRRVEGGLKDVRFSTLLKIAESMGISLSKLVDIKEETSGKSK
jgi:transcriptional regulator with XRE-family HTH domain